MIHPASKAQTDYVRSLYALKRVPAKPKDKVEETHLARLREVLGGMAFVDVAEVSALIDYMRRLPWRGPARRR